VTGVRAAGKAKPHFFMPGQYNIKDKKTKTLAWHNKEMGSRLSSHIIVGVAIVWPVITFYYLFIFYLYGQTWRIRPQYV
jgi:hypothetical protein